MAEKGTLEGRLHVQMLSVMRSMGDISDYSESYASLLMG